MAWAVISENSFFHQKTKVPAQRQQPPWAVSHPALSSTMDAVITLYSPSLGGTGCSGPPQWGEQSTWSIISSHCSPCASQAAVRLIGCFNSKREQTNNFLPLYWTSWTYRGVWQAGRSFLWEQKGIRSPQPPERPQTWAGSTFKRSCQGSAPAAAAAPQAGHWMGRVGREGVQISSAVTAIGSWVTAGRIAQGTALIPTDVRQSAADEPSSSGIWAEGAQGTAQAHGAEAAVDTLWTQGDTSSQSGAAGEERGWHTQCGPWLQHPTQHSMLLMCCHTGWLK